MEMNAGNEPEMNRRNELEMKTNLEMNKLVEMNQRGVIMYKVRRRNKTFKKQNQLQIRSKFPFFRTGKGRTKLQYAIQRNRRGFTRAYNRHIDHRRLYNRVL